MQTSECASSAKVPPTHSRQLELPDRFSNCPGEHSWHDTWPALGWANPGSHSTHAVVRLILLDAFPGIHCTQLAWPLRSWYQPGLQGRQNTAPRLFCENPRGHATQCDSWFAPTLSLNRPPLHSRQSLLECAAALFPYLPGRQNLHWESRIAPTVALHRPARQFLHPLS